MVKFSIVVPAFHEAENLKPLTERIFSALHVKKMDKESELIIVDDNSNDGSVEVIQNLQKKGYPVRIIVRTTEKGLSSAVIRGFNESNGDYLLCMDADLQHPPEKVPELFESLLVNQVEFVIGTRYGVGAEVDKDWPLYRRIISKGARMLARPLTPLSDPMTGFFAISREAYERAMNVSSLGFKICMELYVKSEVKKHAEVSIVFGVRNAGESKLTGKVILHYLNHLLQLYMFVYPKTMVIFAFIFLFFFLWLMYEVLRLSKTMSTSK